MTAPLFSGLWRPFATLSDAQTYAEAQTAAMHLPAASLTDCFSVPVYGSDGQWYARWCDQAPTAIPNPTDALAVAWPASVTAGTPPATTITSVAFIARFTPAEQEDIVKAAAKSAAVAALVATCQGAGILDVTQSVVTSGMASLVTAGLLTAARSTQILTLTEASP